ncbi:hypothetical protein B0T10DRAFT_508420 [Thelonectria olida]|uniref:Polyketide synthase n=1 Tax=Thelonectria olida TaxID=1576542 RepID=A0A9P8WDH4_9HYPO|nr:hypothetical protein B0T10DRAFT_508420 [Thelonectria olida]
MDDIAVIGIGLRFPGNATSPEELWKVLERGESQWSEFPKDRLNIDGYFHPGGDRQGSISFRGAHFLKDDFATFDAPFFSVAAEDAKAIDPQQRILLEASYEALENAGIRIEDIDGSDTSVYVGSFVKDYEQVCLRDPDWQPQYAATGNGIAIMANRISYSFNLHGPSMTLDTGCSGSLVSVHLAAQSLRSGEASLAIAAGAGMILTPNTIMPMTALNFLSPDGKCFTFDGRANGYGRGEGIGVVVLKKLSDAIRDNDTIRSVIRGTRVNQDGHTTGITLPSKEAQVANIKGVYKSAGLDFDQTAYVECHGTGTQAGDWRELKAISESLGSQRSADNPIVVGSVKPNIGHLEGAAGVAGLIKGILTLEHGKIPPNINFQRANPDIDFESWRVKVPTKVLDWPLPGLRRVSVNCFGFGGTNAHVIMDEAPRYLACRGMKANHNSIEDRPPSRDSVMDQTTLPGPQLFCFSSHEKAGVSRVMKSHAPYLAANQMNHVEPELLRDYAFTLNSRRSNLEWRHTILADSIQGLVQQINAAQETNFGRASKGKQPKVCFVFSGQGAQYAQMGKDLASFEVFRQSLTEASTYMKSVLGSPFDLVDEITKDANESRISNPEIAQPATTALQVALVDLLASFSVSPKHVIGHSSGEVAAAYACGLVSRQTAWQVAYYRGLAASSIPTKAGALQGGMIATGFSLSEARDYISATAQGLEVACVNSPRSVTLSGTADAIEYASADLSQKKIFCRRLPVTTAYHSTHMELVAEDYKTMLNNTAASEGSNTVTMFSSVTGLPVSAEDIDSQYWVNNMVSTVQYVKAVEAVMALASEERPDTLIELSPVAALKSPTMDIFASIQLQHHPLYLSVLERKVDGVKSLLKVVGDLWAHGSIIDMEKVVSRGHSDVSLKCLADLPPYPWNHTKSYWHESHLGEANRFREFPRQDLIGAPTADAISFEPRWRGFLRISENPWLQDHQVQKTIVYPAAGMVAMALQGATQLAKDKSNLLGYDIADMKIEKAMIIPTTAHGLEMAMNFKKGSGEGQSFEFTIYSKQLGAPWEQHATGSIQVRTKVGDWRSSFRHHEAQFNQFKGTCTEPVVPRQLYELLDINMTEIWKGDSVCVGRVRIPDTRSKMPAKFEYDHLIHPAALDSMFQTLFAIDNEPMVPTFIKRMFVSADISRELGNDFVGYATAARTGIRDANANIVMAQDSWSLPSIVVEGLHFTGLAGASQDGDGFLPNHRNLCTEIIWDEDVAFADIKDLERLVKLMAHKYPAMSVLQIGGGSVLAKTILKTLAPIHNQTPRLFRYTVAKGDGEQTALEVLSHVKNTHLEPLVEARHVDGSVPLPEYQLIIVCDKANVDVSQIRKHLKTDGILLEQDQAAAWPSVSYTSYKHGVEARTAFHTHRSAALEESKAATDVVIVVPSGPVDPLGEAAGLAARLQAGIQLQNAKTVTLVPADQVSNQMPNIKGKLVISLLEFRGSESIFQWVEDDFKAFHALQKAAKGIIFVTQAAHMKPSEPTAAPIIALARTLMTEDPLKTIATIDLGKRAVIDEASAAEIILRVLNRTFGPGKGSAPQELEYAEEDGRVYIPRLVPITPLNKLVEKGNAPDFQVENFHKVTKKHKLQILQPGLVDNALAFTAAPGSAIGSDEVEVLFESAPINHVDLEVVMGRTVDSDIGMDVSGQICRVGSNVSGFSSGDKVVALVSGGAIQSRTNINKRLVRKPTTKLPLSYATCAYHAFDVLGRVGSGKSVLVHAGASPFGLAAIHVAAQLGAEIFTTVMEPGLAEQRLALEKVGFRRDRILEAASDSFAKIVKELNGGRGVDVVYNSTQKHIEANFSCVRNGGMVIQFASKSPSPSAVRITLSSISLVNLDFSQLLKDDPEYVAELLDGTLELLKRPGAQFTLDAEVGNPALIDIERAFQQVQKQPYLGFVSVHAAPDKNPQVKVATPKVVRAVSDVIRKDKTYVLAGGLGGLGRCICELLVNNGARHVAFLSRSGASSQATRLFIQTLKEKSVDARVYKVDICNRNALAETNALIASEMPPVAGVFQCAAVIKDAVFDNMTYSDWESAVMPKTHGSQNLVDTILCSDQKHPFFIFLASSAGVIGNRGQANYAAGNCFEDALARSLRLQGRHAVSIDLGPVLGAGMLADDEEILDMLRASGFYGIRHQDFMTMVHHAITMEIGPQVQMPPQVIMGIGTGGLILQNQPADPYWARTSLYTYLNLIDMPPPDLDAANGSSNVDLKSMLARCTNPASAAEIICTGLSHMLAKAMNMLPEEIDTGKPPNVYGVDSLVAVGVRNWVLSNCGVPVSVFEVLSDKTIVELAADIVEKGRFGVERD